MFINLQLFSIILNKCGIGNYISQLRYPLRKYQFVIVFRPPTQIVGPPLHFIMSVCLSVTVSAGDLVTYFFFQHEYNH